MGCVEIFKVTVRGTDLKFSAAHFLIGENVKEGIHGHNYEVEVSVWGALNADYMVVDFRKLRDLVKEICKSIDHKVIIPKNNGCLKVSTNGDKVEVRTETSTYVFPRDDVAFLPIEASTAELLAKYLCDKIIENLLEHHDNIYGVEVKIYEHAGSCATYTRKIRGE
ncbi:MAG: 6-pyruvoyl trahydropterin synthase family protein [Candidatus Baldrarchaeia archaeon]